jgi:hypothetical protein
MSARAQFLPVVNANFFPSHLKLSDFDFHQKGTVIAKTLSTPNKLGLSHFFIGLGFGKLVESFFIG